jgi:hypothetical protein
VRTTEDRVPPLGPQTAAATPGEAMRGLVGVLEFDYAGPALAAVPQTDLSAPMLIRLERGATSPDGSTHYVVRFLGTIEGEHDLRPLIQRADGGAANDLPPLPVRVVSSLEDRLSTDLYAAADLDVGFVGRYETTMWLLLTAWLAVPALALILYFARRRPAPPPPEVVHEPTLEELIAPLCEAAKDRELTVDEKGRLELLLYRHWQRRLALGGTEAETATKPHDDHRAAAFGAAIAQLRRDERAQALILDVERWLHARGGEPIDPERLRVAPTGSSQAHPATNPPRGQEAEAS